MSIFPLAKTRRENFAAVDEQLQEVFPDDYYSMRNGSWLVSTEGTAKGLSRKLGISDGDITAVIVVEVDSYHVRADPAIWSWIKDKWEGQL